MLSRFRAVVVAALTASAFFVGVWAAFFPRGFHDAFPWFHRLWSSAPSWVIVDGPYNEHLVRDTGSLYLALGVAGVLTLIWRGHRESVLLGAAWATFSVLHFGYHMRHLDMYGRGDQIGNVIGLGGTLVLALLLLIPRRRPEPSSGTPATEVS